MVNYTESQINKDVLNMFKNIFNEKELSKEINYLLQSGYLDLNDYRINKVFFDKIIFYCVANSIIKNCNPKKYKNELIQKYKSLINNY